MVNRRDILGDVRHVVAADGGHWRVYERSSAAYDRRHSLVFESETTIRRVRNFPADWRSLPDEALYQLSWRL